MVIDGVDGVMLIDLSWSIVNFSRFYRILECLVALAAAWLGKFNLSG